MCTDGALAMYSSNNCVFYLCTGVVVTISYSCVLEIHQRPCIRAVSWVEQYLCILIVSWSCSDNALLLCTGDTVNILYFSCVQSV